MTPSTESMPALPVSASDYTTQPRFALGRIVATPGALRLLEETGVTPLALLARHAAGDWGEVCADDARANDAALIHGERVLSAYILAPGPDDVRIWAVTEADRSATILLLPSEY
jgi:hypothetical protein